MQRSQVGFQFFPFPTTEVIRERRDMIQQKSRTRSKKGQELWRWYLRIPSLIRTSLRGRSHEQTCRNWKLSASLSCWVMYEMLPAQTNQHRYSMMENHQCRLYGERGMLAHILLGCRIELFQRTYKWDHDRVLATLPYILKQEVSSFSSMKFMKRS